MNPTKKISCFNYYKNRKVVEDTSLLLVEVEEMTIITEDIMTDITIVKEMITVQKDLMTITMVEEGMTIIVEKITTEETIITEEIMIVRMKNIEDLMIILNNNLNLILMLS
jgi:hypothetical protein